jgi:hypothetical protein
MILESWEMWERELDDHEIECECCDCCGNAIQNGEAYYEINGEKICEYCMDDVYRRVMDYDCRDDEYTYEDYLTEKYERERHDV